MKNIGIICASDEELAPFLPRIKTMTQSKKAMITFYHGTIDGTIDGLAIVALYSGVGKVNAAIASQILIDDHAVDTILNVGTE